MVPCSTSDHSLWTRLLHFLLPTGDCASLGYQFLHLGTSTQSLTEGSVGALGWQIHAVFSRIHLHHSLNLLAPNSARKRAAISWASSSPMSSHLLPHLTFLSRPHARWGQAGTSSVWFIRHRAWSLTNIRWMCNEQSVRRNVTPLHACSMPNSMWGLSVILCCLHHSPWEVGLNIPNLQVRIEIIIK